MYGIVTPTGLALHHNGRSVPLVVTSVTPLGVDVADAIGFDVCPTHNVLRDVMQYDTEAWGMTVVDVPIGYACPVCIAEADAQDAAAEALDMDVTPLGQAVREACAAILAGELEPCRWCESIAPCDCLRWHEYMLLQDPDPHGDLSAFDDCEIPY